MKKTILFLFIILTISELSAQRTPVCRNGGCDTSPRKHFSLFGKNQFDSNTIIKYKLEYLQGEILDHDEKVSPLIMDNTSGFEFAVEFPKYGGKDWFFYYNFPTVGYGFRYLDLGNPDFLGESYTVYPYLNLPLINAQLFSFNIKMGAGLAYLTKKFDPDIYNPNFPEAYETNNFAISSNLNLYLDLGLNTEIKFSKSRTSVISRFSLTGDIGLNHFSNGSFSKPNTGLNMVTAGVGIKYSPYLTLVPQKSGISRMKRQWYYEPVLAVGMNEQHLSDTKKYLNASLNLGAYRPLSNIYRFGVGLDLFYNQAYFAERTLPDYYAGETNKLRAGVSIANELMFGNFIAGIHVGAYALNQIEHDGFIYSKIVAKYKIYDNLFLTAAVKTHMEVAENMEIGLGYFFTKKEKAPYSWIPEKQKAVKKSGDPDPNRHFLGMRFKKKRM